MAFFAVGMDRHFARLMGQIHLNDANGHGSDNNPFQRRVKKNECTSCGDNVPAPDMLHALCGHDHCRACVQEMVTLSLKDHTLYPPRCCQQALFKLPVPESAFTSANESDNDAISAEDKDNNAKIRALLTGPRYEAFLLRILEKETTNPLYCRAADCAAFIPPYMIRDGVGFCTSCVSITCADCKAAWHEGDCVHYEGDERVAELAAANGWRKCESCGMFVELQFGCNHMTCRCGAQFCYLCGATWKTCSCIFSTEQQLLAPAPAHQQQQQPQQQQAQANEAAAQAYAQIGAHNFAQTTAFRPLFHNGMNAYMHMFLRGNLPMQPPMMQNYALLQGPHGNNATGNGTDGYNRVHNISHHANGTVSPQEHEWRRAVGSRVCSRCLDVMPHYTLECTVCHSHFCRRCAAAH